MIAQASTTIKNDDPWGNFWLASTTTVDQKDASYLSDLIKFDHIKAILPKKKTGTCLEVGSGSGRVSAWLAGLGYSSICLDNSSQALDLAKQNFKKLNLKGKFILGDAEKIPLKDNSIDVIFSTGLLEHFEDAHAQIIVDEMVRVLKPGGIFFSDIVPSKFSFYRLFNFYKPLNIGGIIIHEGRYRPRDIYSWLSRAQLKKIEVFAAGVLPPIGVINRLAAVRKASYLLRPFWMKLDHTFIANLTGYYYFAHGVKKK